jgi:CO/xanthine dehydrogenase Mo-binding subunit
MFLKIKTLAGPQIDHYHQAVALVVAETFEQARDAAALLRISYARVDGRFELAAQRGSAPLAPAYILGPPESRINDFDGAFAAAPVQLDETYTTPDHSHAMMEPQATIAAWEGDDVTCWLRSPRTAPCSPPSCSQRRLPRGQRAATDHTRRLVPISALPGRTRSWHGRACRPR